MSTGECLDNLPTEKVRLIFDLLASSIEAPSIDTLASNLLPGITGLTRAHAALFYLFDPVQAVPCFYHHGIQSQSALSIERLCAVQLDKIMKQPGQRKNLLSLPADWQAGGSLMVYELNHKSSAIGILGLVDAQNELAQDIFDQLLLLIAQQIEKLSERIKVDRQLAQLNTYLTVSSMMSQSQGLHDSLEVALYCCMEIATAETASVLLLDDERQNFRFYQVEGPTKPVLETAIFPADQGLAGAVLQSRQSEVINDVPNDPRFYGKIDADSGFQTRNMIAIPLIAGEEPVGVLEVLNKIDGTDFTEDENLMLLSIAEEIAFGIRNAIVFEYVVNNYCKQRQGLGSCRGCERPLGSWTPCVKYQEADL